MKYKLIGAAFFVLSSSVHSGLDRTTVHSRANCLNNESITWWYLHPYDWRVVSYHCDQGITSHQMDTGFDYTWRQHAIHWGEGNLAGSWKVWGYHYESSYHRKMPFDQTYAETCQLIEGW